MPKQNTISPERKILIDRLAAGIVAAIVAKARARDRQYPRARGKQ